MTHAEKILMVDDDQNLLEGCVRQLRKRFTVDTGLGGEQGLAALATHGPYAVVVSDLRMPGMDGLQFLSQVKALAPETVRMMLTGYPDMQAAIDAINEGNVFRFLTKPCSPESLTQALEAGIAQYWHRRHEEQHLAMKLRRALACLEPTHEVQSEPPGVAPTPDPVVQPDGWPRAPADLTPPGPGQRCLTAAWQQVAAALQDLKQITDGLAVAPEAEAGLSRAAIIEALRHTIQALADTRHSFKSKEIAEVRHQLEALLK